MTKVKHESSSPGWGLVAYGSSGPWDVTVDESLERDGEWIAEIEGPRVYMAFGIRGLETIAEALEFLGHRAVGQPLSDTTPRPPSPGELHLGTLGSNPLLLIRDDEHVDRYFLVVGPLASSTLRLGLTGADVEMLVKALEEVVQDLPLSGPPPHARDPNAPSLPTTGIASEA